MDQLIHYRRAYTVLRCSLLGILIYGIGMVVAGRYVAFGLFDVLGFGPKSASLDSNGEKYAIFCFGVLGSCIVGWMNSLLSFLSQCEAPQMSRELRTLGRQGIFRSTSIWFVFDTTFSIVIGQYNHAIFNIPFAMVIMTPLYLMHRNEGDFGVDATTTTTTKSNIPNYGTTTNEPTTH